MNYKSIIAVLTAVALLGASLTSCFARPGSDPDTAPQTSLTQPAGEEPAPSHTDTPDAPDTALTPETAPDETPAPESESKTGTETSDDSTAAPARAGKERQETPVTPAAPAEAAPADSDSGAVQVADKQQNTGNDHAAEEQGNGGQNINQNGSQEGGQNQGGGQDSEPSGTTVQAADVLNLTNQARQANGLAPLAASAEQAAADTRAREIARVFDHTRPDGTSCFTAVSGSYANMGENIAYIQGQATAQDFLNLWMGSEGHRANILGSAYEAAAIGIYYDGATNTTYAVQLFFGAPISPSEPTYTYTDTVVAPTCTEQGYTLHTCNEDAGRSYKDSYVDALGHDFVDGVCTRCGAADPDYKPELTYTYTDTVVAPTCTEQGYTLHTCNEDAGRSFKDSYTAPLGHEFDGKNLGAKCIRCHTDLFVFSHTVEATCQDGGCDVYVSILDPNDIRMNNFTDPLDHHFVDGVCTECGAKDDSYHPSYGDNYDRTYYNNTIASLTNQARTDRGQSALRYASEYQAAADTRAQELITSFSHTRPDGTNPETALDALGAEYDAFGENIAYVSAMYKPSKIVDNWIASPGHFTNMMNGSYDSFVVGTACDGTYVYAVQIFFSTVDDASLTLSEETENTAPALPAAEPEADAGKEAAPTEETAPAEEAADNTVILPEQETPAPEATAETLPAQDGEEAADVDTGSGLTEETPAPEAAPETVPETGPESAAETVPAPQAPAEPAEPTPGDEVSEEPAAGPEVSGDAPADTPVQEAPAEGQAE